MKGVGGERQEVRGVGSGEDEGSREREVLGKGGRGREI